MLLNAQDFKQPELQDRVHADLSKRARGGIVIYLLAWLFMTLPAELYAKQPIFFYLNTLVLVGIMLSRFAHLFVKHEAEWLDPSFRRHWLVWSILASALHWGFATSWIVSHPEYVGIENQMIVAAAVLAIAGTATLSIAREIRFLYSPFILGPLFISLIARGGADDLVLSAMAILAVSYITITANTANQDYWQAIGNEQLAEQRALQMEKLSYTDQLTQLNNRSYFDRRYREEWKRGSRLKSQLSILMIDLDHFKALNDKYGHLLGDQCLQRVAAALRIEMKRETDILARYGGEEFVVILPDTNAPSAAVVGDRLRLAVAACEVVNAGELVSLSCSIGAATMQPIQHLDSEFLLERADVALYKAKALGRNQYVAAEVASTQDLHAIG